MTLHSGLEVGGYVFSCRYKRVDMPRRAVRNIDI